MKNIFITIILFCSNIAFAETTFKGNINFLQQDNKQLTSSHSMENIVKLYEGRKMLISISNVLSVDLDQFKNEIKEVNVFTAFRIEF